MYRLIAKKKMKRVVLMIIPALICGVMFTNCDADKQEIEQEFDDDGLVLLSDKKLVIRATRVENSSKDIVTVKAIFSPYNEDYEVASANYKNGGFELTLPATVPDEYLGPHYRGGGTTVSDEQARTGAILQIFALDKARAVIGDFRLQSDGGGIILIYADRSYTMKGGYSSALVDFEFDCSFNKGWNILYSYWPNQRNLKQTTQRPIAEKYHWNYGKYEMPYPPRSQE